MRVHRVESVRKTVYNFSDYVLTKNEEDLLKLGLDTTIRHLVFHWKNTLLRHKIFENRDFFSSDEQVVVDRMKQNFVNDANAVRKCVQQYLDMGLKMKMKSNLTSSERKTLFGLRKKKDIMVIDADKGKAVVIVNTTDYIDKLTKSMVGGDDYKIDKRKTRLQWYDSKVKTLLKQLKISEVEKRRLKSSCVKDACMCLSSHQSAQSYQRWC